MDCRSQERLVIINADDFGWSRGVSAGIVEAHVNGVLTSTTLAANMPAAADCLDMLKDAPALGVGVHLNVAQGPTLSKLGRRLAGPDGLMNRTAVGVIKACLFRPWLLAAVEAEFDAQIRWVIDHGIRPTHLDSHRHAHAFGPIARIVERLARRYGIDCIRRPIEKLPPGDWPATTAKARRVAWMVGLAWRLGRHDATLFPATGTLGIAHTGQIDSTYLIQAAASAQPGITEIMTHPGHPEDLDPSQTRLLGGRRQELAALCDPAVRESFARQGIKLVHYGTIQESR